MLHGTLELGKCLVAKKTKDLAGVKRGDEGGSGSLMTWWWSAGEAVFSDGLSHSALY